MAISAALSSQLDQSFMPTVNIIIRGETFQCVDDKCVWKQIFLSIFFSSRLKARMSRDVLTRGKYVTSKIKKKGCQIRRVASDAATQNLTPAATIQ